MIKPERVKFLNKFYEKNYFVSGGYRSGKTQMAYAYEFDMYRTYLPSVLYTQEAPWVKSLNMPDPVRIIFDVPNPEDVLPQLPELDKKGITYSLYFTPTTLSFLEELKTYNFVAHYNIGGINNIKDIYEEFNSQMTTPVVSSFSSTICPRCSSQMIKKISSSLFGDPFDVLKCPNCHYCN